jgi:hypothetical protein
VGQALGAVTFSDDGEKRTRHHIFRVFLLSRQLGIAMTLTMTQGSGGDEFAPLIEVDMEANVFGESWSHCDQLSSYVARMVSHNRSDSLLYSNLFSSALNELLETAFRAHAAPGKFRCRVWRKGKIDRVELIIPCEPGQIGFYLDTVTLAHRDDAVDRYRGMLFSEGRFDHRTGLMELAIDYAAVISASRVGDDAICLTADLALEIEDN